MDHNSSDHGYGKNMNNKRGMIQTPMSIILQSQSRKPPRPNKRPPPPAIHEEEDIGHLRQPSIEERISCLTAEEDRRRKTEVSDTAPSRPLSPPTKKDSERSNVKSLPISPSPSFPLPQKAAVKSSHPSFFSKLLGRSGDQKQKQKQSKQLEGDGQDSEDEEDEDEGLGSLSEGELVQRAVEGVIVFNCFIQKNYGNAERRFHLSLFDLTYTQVNLPIFVIIHIYVSDNYCKCSVTYCLFLLVHD